MDAIKVEKLTKRYKNCIAVDGLDLTIQTGELFALLGVNGAGKTTLIKMLSCLTKPSDGNAFLLGKSILSDTASVKEIIGVSPQETAIAPQLTVRENIAFMCGVYGLKGEKKKERTEGLIKEFSLTEIRDKKAGKLSGGWQRRLSIAMALVGNPQILFLDEPTLGLDVLARSDLWDTIRALKGKITVILTTHYMEEAEALADRIGIMKEGKLLALGSVDEIKAQAGEDTVERAFVTIVKGVKGE